MGETMSTWNQGHRGGSDRPRRGRSRNVVARVAARAIVGSALTAMVSVSSGCFAVKKLYEPNPKPAKLEPIRPEAYAVMASDAEEGSLWPGYMNWNWFSDDKALRKGDIVLVRVAMNNKGKKDASTETDRSSSIAATIKWFLGLENGINKLTDYNVPSTDDNPAYNPNELIKAESTRSFSGDGTTERRDDLTATVSAVVTDVLRNGNLVIHGHQIVQLNNESSVLTVQGIIRPTDIAPDNSIASTRIADARIEFTGSGVISDNQHPGVAVRIFDWVWPF